MIKTSALSLSVALVLAVGARPDTASTETWTGWFSDKSCARVSNDTPRPNGTACVKKCLAEGAALVFISEQATAVFDVLDYPSGKDDAGYHLEVTGTVDAKARTISIKSVKRLAEVADICLIPKKVETKKQ